MTDFVMTQGGDAKDGAQYGNTSPGVEGTDYPDFTNGGDTLNTAGFAATNISGILGDDTATAALIIGNGGSATLSGDLQTRSTSAQLDFRGGTFEQGAHALEVAPNANGATLLTLASQGVNASVWNASAGARIRTNLTRGATSVEGMNTGPGDAAHPGTFAVAWAAGVKYHGFGDGETVFGFYWSAQTGDSFTWDGGAYVDCGQIVPNLGPQGANIDSTFRMDGVAIGAWRGTFSAASRDTQPMPLRNFFNTNPTVVARITNCALFHDDPSDGYSLWPEFMGPGPLDLSGTRYINYGGAMAQQDVTLDGGMLAITNELDDVTFAIGRDATSTQSCNDFSVVGSAPNAHLLTIQGDGSGTTYPISGLFFDGCGFTFPGDPGDMPMIYSQRVEGANWLMVHSGGWPQPSLDTDAEFQLTRGTMHAAGNVLCGEAQGNATMIGDFKNCLISAPYTGAMFTQGGTSALAQSAASLNYNAFNPAEMDSGNLTHGTLGGLSYLAGDMSGILTDGANDIAVNDFGFADTTRHGYTWAASLGFAQSGAGLRDALLAYYGIDINGDDVAANASATPANYRAYMQAGYTSNNQTFAGAGEGGVDLGAFDIAPLNPLAFTTAPSEVVRTGTDYTLTISGGGFGASQGSGSVTLGTPDDVTVVSQTVQSWSDTSVTFDVAPGALTVGATDLVIRLTTDGGQPYEEEGVTLRHPRTTFPIQNLAGSALASETGIAWWVRPDRDSAPDDSGTGETTDGSGDCVISLPTTTMTPGDGCIIDAVLDDNTYGVYEGTVA